jgi:site-specific recombinase XerD
LTDVPPKVKDELMKQLRILRIVVASPNDVKDERNILAEVATELNRGIAKDHALHIEISRWETDAFPGFHAEGAQGIIDTVLHIEDCDLLIGIFWKRFGTPTSDAKSGTEHEFRKAYEAWKRNQHPQLMIYFNKKPYAPESKEEIEQWGQVLELKREISQEGRLWSYNGKSQFERLVRNHLTQFILSLPPLEDALFGLSQKTFTNNASTTITTPSHSPLSVDKQISLWLEIKASNSPRTRKHYVAYITGFRRELQRRGFDLDCENEKVVSPLVQHWADHGMKGNEVSDYTYNTRLSALNSFYQFACEHHWMRSNPIEMVKRRKEKRREPNYAGNILNLDTIVETITSGLKSIDRKTLLGKRDYALLSILFKTLRRVSEVKDLKCGDISITGNSITVTWRRTAGGKVKRTQLSPDISRALLDYLEEVYGDDKPHDAPLWLSYSRYNKGQPIGTQAISAACERYLKITKVEIIRQTLMALGEREGTKEVEKSLDIN